jgi:hypothetical protein
MQIKTQWDSTHTHLDNYNYKKSTKLCWQEYGEIWTLCIAGGSVKQCRYSNKNYYVVQCSSIHNSQKMKMTQMPINW